MVLIEEGYGKSAGECAYKTESGNKDNGRQKT